jgi:hypothetical protein
MTLVRDMGWEDEERGREGPNERMRTERGKTGAREKSERLERKGTRMERTGEGGLANNAGLVVV